MAFGESPAAGIVNILDNVFASSNVEPDSASASEDTSLTPELRNAVLFGTALTSDKIFDSVFMASRNGEIRPVKDVLTCRLVDHTWLEHVTYRLQKSESPHYKFVFNSEFQKFLDTWVPLPSAPSRSRIPLFKLNFAPSYLSSEGVVQNLVKCLIRGGKGLHSLVLDFDTLHIDNDEASNSTSFVASTSRLDLPNLTELEIILPVLNKNQPLAFLLLSSILSGCNQLSYLSLSEYFREARLSSLSLEEAIFESELPTTLVKIEISAIMTSQLLENLLLGNSLPNLTWLKLRTWGEVDNVLFRILLRFSQQLNHLFLYSVNSKEGVTSSSARVTFPGMRKLNEMSISYLHFEPKAGVKQPFPVLKTLNVECQTVSMLKTWTQNSPFGSVEDLTVKFVGGLVNEIFTLELSEQLHVAFRHVQKLDINFGSFLLEDGSIQKIFQHMTQLRELSLRTYISDETTKDYSWDAILLGITLKDAKNLSNYLWEHWDFNNPSSCRTPSHSILNISNLTTFLLKSTNALWADKLLISDVSFKFAFLRMPKLHKLTLDDGFGASLRMEHEWRELGREFHGHVIGR